MLPLNSHFPGQAYPRPGKWLPFVIAWSIDKDARSIAGALQGVGVLLYGSPAPMES